MVSVDYAFYRDAFGGTRTEAEFARLAPFAGAWLGEITSGRVPEDLTELSDDEALRVRLAFCAVIDTHGEQEAVAGVAAETNDGISVTYTADEGDRRRRLYDAAAVYLGTTGLLYRGVV